MVKLGVICFVELLFVKIIFFICFFFLDYNILKYFVLGWENIIVVMDVFGFIMNFFVNEIFIFFGWIKWNSFFWFVSFGYVG